MENERGEIRLTRKELYDEIWKSSVAGVSRKYGLNYAKLIKACKDACIPYPSSGYWTKYNMGKDVSAEVIPLTGDENALVDLDGAPAEEKSKKKETKLPISGKENPQPDVPVIVRDMTDDEAVVLMVDSNLQRENILPSERAFAYKMKMEAMKHQGERTDLQGEGTSTQVVSKSRSNEILGMQNDQSRETVRRFIRLTNLIPELLDMLDQKLISFNPAVELSYLTPDEQKNLLEAMDYTQAAPSLSQAQRLKKLSQEGGCALEDMCEILGEVKKGDLERVAFKSEQLRKYFPKSYSPKQMQDTIIKLLEQWQKKRQRGMEL